MNEKGFPKFQYSLFLDDKRDEQIVIRTDTWEEFIEAKKDIDKIVNKRQEKTEQELGNCSKCGAPNKLSKNGKPYCSKLCWK